MPAGFTPEGLPVGIQIVGRRHDDLAVLQVGHAFEQATGVGQVRPPPSPVAWTARPARSTGEEELVARRGSAGVVGAEAVGGDRAQPAGLEVLDGLDQLGPGVHHERAVGRDRLPMGCPPRSSTSRRL